MAKIWNPLTKKWEEDENTIWNPATGKYQKEGYFTQEATTKKDKNGRSWFQSGAFEDGFDLLDIPKTILGTASDIQGDIGSGLANIGEGLVDTSAYGLGRVGKFFGNDELEKDMQSFIKRDLTGEIGIKERIANNSVWGMHNNIISGNFDALNPFSEANKNDDIIEQNSVLGDKTDSLVQSAGQLLGATALQTVGVPWQVTTGITSFGGGVEEAYQNGATSNEAGLYGIINAGSEILAESLFQIPGLKASGSGKFGKVLGKFASKMSETTVRNLINLGINSVGEGLEEVLTSAMQRLGQSLTYENENTIEELIKDKDKRDAYVKQVIGKLFGEEAREEYKESFIGGAAMGGVLGTPKTIEANKQGRDINTGLTDSEQKIIDSITEERTSDLKKQATLENELNKEIKRREQKQNGTLSDANKQELRKNILSKIESGEIDTSKTKISKKELAKVQEEVQKMLTDGEYDLSKIEDILTPTETAQIQALEQELANTKDDTKRAEIEAKIKQLESARFETLKDMLPSNNFLNKAVYETRMKGQKYIYDENSVTDEYEKGVKDSAKEYANNTTKVRNFIENVSKLAKDRKRHYRFTNNLELLEQGDLKENTNLKPEEIAEIKKLEKQLEKATTKEQKQAIQNKLIELKYLDTGGFVRTKDGVETVVLNIDSKQSLSAVVGHETRHLLEKNGKDINDAYNKLLFDYAKSKGDYDIYKERIERNYTVDGKLIGDIDSELSAALTGDYLFTDSNFIETLLNDADANTPKIVKIIKDLIDDLVIRFKGTEQEKQLREVQKKFKELYKQQASTENVASKETETQYSLISEKGANEVVKKNKNNQWLIEDLNTAKADRKKGLSNEEIRRKTGWFQDPNGKWLFEIPDNEIEINESVLKQNSRTTLKELLPHEVLYLAYGDRLANTPVITSNFERTSIAGKYDDETREIFINNWLIANNETEIIRNTLLHEAQHIIQEIEGLEKGSDSENPIKYFTSLGEIQASNVEVRSRKDIDWLKENAPETAKQYPIHEQLKEIHRALNSGKPNVVSKTQKYLSSDSRLENLYNEIYNYGKEGVYNRKILNKMGITKKGAFEDARITTSEILRGVGDWFNKRKIRGGKNQKKALDTLFEEPKDGSFFNTQYSISDNKGRKLTKEQQEFFKDVSPEVKDENGNLLTVYHTMTNEDIQFNEFNPIGTEYYRFGDQVVNFFTDSQDMSSSYANYKYTKAKTNKLNSVDEALQWVKSLNETEKALKPNTFLEWKLEKDTKGRWVFYNDGTIKTPFETETDMLRNLQTTWEKKSNIKHKYQYEGYVNITNPYVIDAEGKSWNDITDGYDEINIRALSQLSDDLKQEFVDLAEKSINNLETDTTAKWEDDLFNKESDELMEKLSVETNDNYYFGKYELFDIAKNGFTEDAIRDRFRTTKTTNEIVKQVLAKNELGSNYDGVIIKNVIDYGNGIDVTPNNVYVTFNSNQFKAVDNLNPTSDADIRYSLSDGEIAPIGDYNIYGKDIKQQSPNQHVEELIAPIREDIAPIRNGLTDEEQQELDMLESMPFELTTEEQARLNELQAKKLTTPIRENIAPMVNETSDKPTSAREWKEKAKKRSIEQKVEDTIQKQSYKNAASTSMYGKRLIKLNEKERRAFRDSLLNLTIKRKDQLTNANDYDDVRQIIRQFADREFNYIDETLQEAKRDVRSYRIKVDDYLQSQITDYGYFRKANFGNLNLAKDGRSIDSVWQELNERYPYYFTDDATSEADMLYQLADFMKQDVTITEKYRLSDDDIEGITSKIYNKIVSNALSQEDLEFAEQDITTQVERRTRQVVQNELLEEMGITKEVIDSGKKIKQLDLMRTDPIRVNEKIFGWKNGQIINDATVNTTIKHEAERIRFLNQERAEIKALGIKPRSKESSAVQKYGEKQYVNDKGELIPYGDRELAMEFPDIATQNKIKRASQILRSKYDTYIDVVNNELERMGYDPIPKRKDYMRHFEEMTDIFSKLGTPLNPTSLNENNLPTDINGLTDEFKPGKSWFANAQQRKGVKTIYDAITGIDGYLESVSNVIYHTEDIQRYRTLSKFIRTTYSDKALQDYDVLRDEAKIEALDKAYKGQQGYLAQYVAWLDEQANALAGKKGKLDRGMEELFGRKIYSVLNDAKKQVGSNMTGFNVRSAMTNFASAVQGMSKTKKLAWAKGTLSTFQNIIKDDGLIDKSNFLTTRFGSEQLSKKMWQKVANYGQIFMTGTDYFTANQIWRSKYYENLDKGMSEEMAIKNADDFASRIMGNRAKGTTAQIFNSQTLGLLTQFQLEVNNQWSSIMHDNKMEIEKGQLEGKTAKATASVMFNLGQLAVFSNIFNTIMTSLTGSDVMLDPIELLKKLLGDDEEEEEFSERVVKVLGEIVDDVPFISTLTGGGRIPISEAFNGLGTLGKKLTGGTDDYGNEYEWDDVWSDLFESSMYWVMPTGYGQVKKTVKGLSMYDDDLPIAGSYTDSGNLRFTVEDTPGNRIKSGLFGEYANEEAQEYIDSGFKTIRKNNINELIDLGMKSSKYRDLKADITASGTKNEDKVDYITSRKDLTDKQKNILVNNVLDRKYDVDVSNYSDYSSYEEFDYYYKNPEKYAVITHIDTYENYMNYKDEIENIKKRYATTDNMTSKQKTAIANQRKKAVQQYIESLSLSVPQKLMLEKMAGGYSISNYENYMFNYIESLPLSAKEKQEIHNQLFD